jgi:hypothetical protein
LLTGSHIRWTCPRPSPKIRRGSRIRETLPLGETVSYRRLPFGLASPPLATRADMTTDEIEGIEEGAEAALSVDSMHGRPTRPVLVRSRIGVGYYPSSQPARMGRACFS